MAGATVGHLDVQRSPEERRRPACTRFRGPTPRGVSDHVPEVPTRKRARSRVPGINRGAPRHPLRGNDNTLEAQGTSGDTVAPSTDVSARHPLGSARPFYLSSPATRLIVMAMMTIPNRYDRSECLSAVRRIVNDARSVSETWKVMPIVNATYAKS
jgi:hypothetical protein